MTENLLFTIIVGVMILYSMGGLGLWPFKKGWRRYGIPLLLLGASMISGSINIRVILSMLILSGILHLGYGEHSNWFKRIIYALGLALSATIIRFNFWQVITPIIFIGTYVLSNKPKWQYIFNWRICEALTGIVLGIQFSQVL